MHGLLQRLLYWKPKLVKVDRAARRGEFKRELLKLEKIQGIMGSHYMSIQDGAMATLNDQNSRIYQLLLWPSWVCRHQYQIDRLVYGGRRLGWISNILLRPETGGIRNGTRQCHELHRREQD